MLDKHFGCVRFVYNWGLAKKKELYEKEKKSVGKKKLQESVVKELKQEHEWPKEVNSQSLINAVWNLDTAYKNFFTRVKKGGGKAGFPRFKSRKDSKQSFQCPQHTKVDFRKQLLKIVKVEDIKIKLHRKFEGEVKTTTISKTASGNIMQAYW